jgi:hypothetical protein
MPIEQIVALLTAERDRLNRAIEALQGPAKRRGRPPKDLSAVSAPAKPKRKFSAATRRKMARAQKKRWADLKAAK